MANDDDVMMEVNPKATGTGGRQYGPVVKMRTKQLKELYLKAFEKTSGHTSASCKATGISRQTFYEWLEKDPAFKDNITAINESFIDLVESKLKEKIEKGDWAAIKYCLENQAGHRGWKGERSQVENKQELSGSVTINLVKSIIPGSAK